MKRHSLFLSTVSVFFFGSLLVSCRTTFVSGPPASGTGSPAQASRPVETVSQQPKVVVVNQPVRVREARPTIQPAAPVVTAKRWAPLVITASPPEVVKEYTDGRKYIKSKDGYFYWKGFDHRWYMEENDLKKVSYSDEEYIDWTTKGKRQSNSTAGADGDKNTIVQPGNSAFGHSRGNNDKVEKPGKEKNTRHANGLATAGTNGDKNTAVRPGNSAFGHSRGNSDKVEKPEKEKNPNHASELANNSANEDKNITGQPGNSAFGHSRGNSDKVEKPGKEKNPNYANGLTKEKEVKDKKDREEKLVKEKEEKDRIEKEVKDKKDWEEKLAKEKVQKEGAEEEGVKNKKGPKEKLSKEKEEKEGTGNAVKDEKEGGKKSSGEKTEKPGAEKDTKKDQDKSAKDRIKEKGIKA